MTRTVRSRFDHEIGGTVEGCLILEKRVVIPPAPAERRLGVFDYLVEGPPPQTKQSAASQRASARSAPEPVSFTRATPGERGGVVRRVPSR